MQLSEKKAAKYPNRKIAKSQGRVRAVGMGGCEWMSLEYKLSPLLEPIAMHCKSFFIQFVVVFSCYFALDSSCFFPMLHSISVSLHNFYSVDYACHTFGVRLCEIVCRFIIWSVNKLCLCASTATTAAASVNSFRRLRCYLLYEILLPPMLSLDTTLIQQWILVLASFFLLLSFVCR